MEVSERTGLTQYAPKYVGVAESLIQDISSGEYEVGDRLPSQNELAKQFGITPVTARKAVDLLKSRGIAKAKEGKGTFVVSCEVGETKAKKQIRIGYVRSSRSGIPDPVYLQIMNGAFSSLHGLGVEVVYFNDSDLETGSLATLVSFSKHVDGLIVPGTLGSNVFDKLVNLSVRLVAVQVKPELQRVSYVGPDFSAAAFLATKHLAKLGHTSLGVVGYFPDFVHTKQFKYGYMRALDEYGIPRQKQFEFWEHDEKGGGYYSIKKMFADPSAHPSAVICMTEHKARIAVRYLSSVGIRVPADVSVIGQYDGFESVCEPPSLTTVCVDPVEVGRRAAEILLNAIQDKSGFQIISEELEPLLIQRETTALRLSGQA